MQETKTKTIRLIELLYETDEDHPYTSSYLVQRLLDDYRIETHRKSIVRDINMLNDEGILDIGMNNKKEGYYLNTHPFELYELKILIDALNASPFISNAATKELKEKLLEHASKTMINKINKSSLIINNKKTSNNYVMPNMEIIMDAIVERKKISFNYISYDIDKKKIYKREGHEYIYNPYSIYYSDNQYLMVGNYDKYDNISQFNILYMRNIKILDESRKPKEVILGKSSEQVLNDKLNAEIYHFDGELVNMTIKTYDYIIDQLIRQFGKDINIKKEDNVVIANITTLDSEGLVFWLMQYSKHVKVLKPAELKNKVISALKEGIKNYE